MGMKFGLATPSMLWDLDWQGRQSMADSIFEAGFDHLFLADHVSFHDGAGADGFVEASAMAQLHDRLGVMTSIYLLPLRHPLPVARQLASMARVAPDRFIFGIGVGGEDRHEVEICGVDPATRGRRANESLSIIRGLLAGEVVTHHGEIFQIDSAVIKPRPKSPIPILVGGRSDAALRRVGRWGDGWIGVWCSTKRFAGALQLINESADGANRGSTPWLHGYQTWIGVDERDEKRAKAAVSSGMEGFYKIPFSAFERYTPVGTPRQIADQLLEYKHVGAELFNLKVCAHDPEEEVALASAIVAEMKKG